MSNKTKFKKGETAYLVKIGANDIGNATVWGYPIQIKSFGTVQGTALRLDINRNALERLYPETVLVRTQEEVREWAAENAPEYAKQRRAGVLRCEESNRNGRLLPKYWAEADARIARLKTEPVTYEVRIYPALEMEAEAA